MLQADGRDRPEPTMDVETSARAVLHGKPAAGRQRAVPDRHGDQDAVRRPRLAATVVRPVTKERGGRQQSGAI